MLPIHSQTLPGHNQETFQQLQSALQGTPPHQLWIAICDDLPLQRQLAATVEESLQVHGQTASTQLFFQVDTPNLAQQLREWAQQFPQRRPPVLQVVGIEQLTYQGADQQYQFLRSLQNLLPTWQQLGCSLLLWLPRPWLKQVKRAVPTLCTTVFEFMGEPTPLSAVASTPPLQAAFSPVRQWQFLGEPEPEPELSELPTLAPDADTGAPQPAAAIAADQPPGEPAPPEPVDVPVFTEELWHRLQADLNQLDGTDATFLPLPSVPTSSSAPTPSPAPTDSDEIQAVPENHEIKAAVVNQKIETGSSASMESVTAPMADSQHSKATAGTEAERSDRQGWALAYALRDRIQAGETDAALLQQAIQQYEALQPQAPTTPHRTEALNDLGSLYWLWSQHAKDLETYQAHLTHSCELYEAALSPTSPDINAETLSRLHSNLGSVYSLLAAHNAPTHCLERAVRSFHRALQYTPSETSPDDYATLQTHLGTAYWSLAQHTQEPAQLHRAISAYQEALQYSEPQQHPQAYAQLLNNLGIALWSLARHERPDFMLEEAIRAYRGALAYRTLEADPAGCAATQNNLGTAYWDLGNHKGERSPAQKHMWQQAIVAYKQALAAAERVPPEALGFDLWATYHSAGVVSDQLAIISTPDIAAQRPCLVQALHYYVKALLGWQAADAPVLETALQAIVRNLHLQGQYLSHEAQQQALEQVPAEWLPEIWRQLR